MKLDICGEFTHESEKLWNVLFLAFGDGVSSAYKSNWQFNSQLHVNYKGISVSDI